jgi:hypothetical protein
MSLLPVICGTIAHCDRTIQGNNATDVTPETTMEAAKQMKLKLQKYKDHLRGWLPRLALFLDPRTDRDWYDLGEDMQDEVRRVLQLNNGMSVGAVEQPVSHRVSDADYISGLMGGGRRAESLDKLDECLQATRSPDHSCKNVLFWWKNFGAAKFPTLARLARDILAVMGSSVPCESAFSRPDRSSISDDHQEKSMLRSWQRALGPVVQPLNPSDWAILADFAGFGGFLDPPFRLQYTFQRICDIYPLSTRIPVDSGLVWRINREHLLEQMLSSIVDLSLLAFLKHYPTLSFSEYHHVVVFRNGVTEPYHGGVVRLVRS